MLELLKNDPDLQAEFKEFWPDGRTGILGSAAIEAGGSEWPSSHKRKEASSAFTGPPTKRKKKVVEKEPPTKPSSSRQMKKPKHHQRSEPQEDYMYENGAGVPNVIVGGNVGMTGPMAASTPDDQAFFERVKKALDNRETYDEFLKLINMFSQDILDMRTLVEKANVFLGDGTELSMTFRRIIGWEERERLVREPDVPTATGLQNLAIYVPHGKENLHHKCGPSYRRIPANVCSIVTIHMLSLTFALGSTHRMLWS
jgi:paired amphipathic helix protein Sin3a